ncbi:UDP-2,4-diacetamido-2,4,6-trideoxy-beta-L-altropyranose hydrolase [Anaerosolibacter carboniphilus]|uniref:UDP-2,4-diacetamido-2,4, 6-trideoxy-beta-L-altropyranose hydrolase n=1 Tax=Anaerosolibacter carboniphilus TaxID=1417629 RepID=A0A841KUP4_9FIRM|nr:UDP-2,4-diacetamido-2,4,6-trideoxy-beta-L-altropyranose hydrolase [Anaerosolibacter carboniphilus]MBB6215730.1 UDP-2,4-diacetamido-2,4,6-trideoxy-beta-L-altropyranose hydrolase [Anaerosolibacter carboniphilus]
MYNVAIRTDGGPGIGMGHIMRCLSLAREFRRSGKRIFFICKQAAGIVKIIEEGFEVVRLENESPYSHSGSDLEKEADNIIKIVQAEDIKVFIIDKYDISADYLLKIKRHVKKLVYIDDLKKFIYPVDIIINGNITSTYINYEKYSEDQHLLLGPMYNLIREEFRDLPKKKINENVRSVMLTTGGSDPDQIVLKFLDIILSDTELTSLKIHVIIGNLFTHVTDLKKIELQNECVILHENISRISEIMDQVDVAISAGGTTLYELNACGVPTLAFVMADNQEFLVEKMHEKGYVISLGWFHQLEATMFLDQFKVFMKDHKLRENMSERGKKLVDGRGVERIVRYIDNIIESDEISSPMV